MAGLQTQTIKVNFGPQHPSTHGVCYLVVELDDEVVIDVEPKIGYLHRSIEKIAEHRYYNQVIPLLDRCDYITAFANELGYVLCVEKLMGLQVPERGEYIRIILTELNRIKSHIFFYGMFGLDLGATTPFLYAYREREKILDLFELVAGYRMTPNYFRVGGVKEDVTDEFLQRTMDLMEGLPAFIQEYDNLLTGNEIFLARTQGLKMLPKNEVVNWGYTGPVARATGIDWDLRKDMPYGGYDKFDFNKVVLPEGDVYDGYRIRLLEVAESIKIVKQAISNLPDGKFRTKVPMILKPPKGEAYSRIESPRGELSYYIVSDGSAHPYRMKMRPPSFTNLMALPPLVKGLKIADLIAIFGVLDIVLGEIDR